MQYTLVILWLHIWFSFDHFMMDEYQNCQDNSNDILIQTLNFSWIFLICIFPALSFVRIKMQGKGKIPWLLIKMEYLQIFAVLSKYLYMLQEVAFLCNILHQRNKNCPQIGFKIQNVKSYQFLIVCVYLGPGWQS